MPSLTRFWPLSMPVPWNQFHPATARDRYAVSPGIRWLSSAVSWMNRLFGMAFLTVRSVFQ